MRLQRAIGDVVRALGVTVAEEYDACGAEYSIDLAIPDARIAIEVFPVANHRGCISGSFALGFSARVEARSAVQICDGGWLTPGAHSRQEGKVLLCCELDGC